MPRFKVNEICKLGKGNYKNGLKKGDKVQIIEVWEKNKITLQQYYVVEPININKGLKKGYLDEGSLDKII